MNLTPGLVKSVMGQAENRTQSGFIGSQIEFTKSVKDCLSQECNLIGVRTGIFKSSGVLAHLIILNWVINSKMANCVKLWITMIVLTTFAHQTNT